MSSPLITPVCQSLRSFSVPTFGHSFSHLFVLLDAPVLHWTGPIHSRDLGDTSDVHKVLKEMRFGGGNKGLILWFFTLWDNKAINSPLSPLPPSLGFLPLHVWSSLLALVGPRASQKPELKVGVIPQLGTAVTGNGGKPVVTTERTSPGEKGHLAVHGKGRRGRRRCC